MAINTNRAMNSDKEDDIVRPERLLIYQKGKEICDMVNKLTALIPENDDIPFKGFEEDPGE